MSEGTKLGELKNSHAFNAAVASGSDVLSEQEMKGTRIGEMSDFEKGLYDEVKPIKSGEKSSSYSFFEEELQRTVIDYEVGDIVKGYVRSIEKSGIMVDIHYKSDGFIPNSEFSLDPSVTPVSLDLKPGDELDVYIVKLETKEGYSALSRKRAEYEVAWNKLIQSVRSKEILEVQITSKVEGGLVAEYKSIRGFVPASQVLKNSDETLDRFIGNTLPVCLLQADRKRRKVIFSHKMASKTKPMKEAAEKAIESIEAGQVRPGTVSSIKDFGVFVDIGGIEGLVHISELSWARINHPSDILKVGDTVDVFILGVDKEHKKISLGMKQLKPDPWVKVSEKYRIDQIVNGIISRTVSFGAFLQLEEDLEGLIHLSELSDSHVEKAESVVQVGQKVTAKIIKLRPEEQKIGLTLKGVQPEIQALETES